MNSPYYTNAVAMEANAKINLFLRVTGRAGNGFHELQMVNLSLELHDDVEVREAPRGSMTVEGSIPGIGSVPMDETNIASRAAERWAAAHGRSVQYAIRIRKRIPVGGGLAGGSTDAAAVLRALGGDPVKVRELALSLGADVPYCLHAHPALVEGIGERITPFRMVRPLHLILVNPGFHVATREIFLSRDPSPAQVASRNDAAGVGDHARLISALERFDLDLLAGSMRNDLEAITARRHPEIETLKDALKESGALFAQMSGSGPTVIGIFRDESSARAAERYWSARKEWSCRTQTIL